VNKDHTKNLSSEKEILHSEFFRHFLSSSFFRQMITLKITLKTCSMAQKCLRTLKLDTNHTFLNRWMIWKVVGLESGDFKSSGLKHVLLWWFGSLF
jgi:hypothetical protein